MFCHCRDPTVNRDAELLTQLVSLAQGSLDSCNGSLVRVYYESILAPALLDISLEDAVSCITHDKVPQLLLLNIFLKAKCPTKPSELSEALGNSYSKYYYCSVIFWNDFIVSFRLGPGRALLMKIVRIVFCLPTQEVTHNWQHNSLL